MVKRLSELLKEYPTKHKINCLVKEGTLYNIEKGIYSDRSDPSEVEVVLAKYPNAVLTLESAYYYYQLSDELPGEYHLATDRKAAKINDVRVVQLYVPTGTLLIGVDEIDVFGEHLRIYDRERLLIETMRYRTKLPYDLYREVISNYRTRIGELDPAKITDYLDKFPKRNMIERILDEEVF